MATYVTGRMVQDETIDTNDLQQGVAIPPGAVMSFAMSAAPVGWLPCDGAAISRTTYASLFAVVGVIHGAGDGSNTFNVPDLRGEFIRGWSAGRAVDTGRTFGSSQIGTAVIHDPNYGSFNVVSIINRANKQGGTDRSNWSDPDNSSADLGVDHVRDAYGTYPNILNSYIGHSNALLELNTSGFGTGMSRPRNIALLYCIKF